MLARLILILACLISITPAKAQSGARCPQNIGFENGTFANWKCYSGSISETVRGAQQAPVISLSETSPLLGQHQLVKSGDSRDEYGDFSLNSPNGSDYVIKLGNAEGGRGAERVSYTLEVPAGVDAYSVIFNYAVVLQNPSHAAQEQPKFTVQIIDETTNSATNCGSFEFVASGSLPGFEPSKKTPSVVFKPWSPVLLNLTEYLGHRIRLEFTTNDCTFNAHFGYVYLDVTENCSYPVTGNVICPGAAPITLKTLPGFNEYHWFDAETKELLGTADSLVLPANTPVGKQIAIKLVPYPGLGCIQTLYTTIQGPQVNVNQPPPDCFSVDITAPSVTAGNSPDLKYTYWMDAGVSIPLVNPKNITKSGSYYIKGQNMPGCYAVGEVRVVLMDPPPINVTDPEPVNYPGTVDITKSFAAQAAFKYSYWKDIKATVPLPNPKTVNRDATFYIKVTNIAGCFTIVPVRANIIYPGVVIPNTFTPNGDGVNDLLTILMDNSIQVRVFKIINKWGATVFATNDIYNYWDGSLDGKPIPAGVYYWFFEGVDTFQRKIRESGSVAVLK